jgi:hypothetical protein
MKNIIKGYITSLLGLAGIILTVLYFFGFLDLPTGYVPKFVELGLALLISISLFVLPQSAIEEKINSLLDKFVKKE